MPGYVQREFKDFLRCALSMIMLTKWARADEGIEADIYTEMTKFAMGDQSNPDSRTTSALSHWRKQGSLILAMYVRRSEKHSHSPPMVESFTLCFAGINTK